MTDSDRFKLLFGPYQTPQVRFGEVLADEVRDRDVVVVAISDARIPWPIGVAARARSLIVYGALAEAVRRESNQAVCYWWGVTAQTVTRWRKSLDVGPATEGTSRLRSEYAFEEPIVEARRKAHAKAGDPIRRAKIAAAKRGKKRPRSAVAPMRKARSKYPSQETKAKLSAAHKARGTWPLKAGRPWTPEEDEVVLSFSAFKAAPRVRRSLRAVYSRKFKLMRSEANVSPAPVK